MILLRQNYFSNEYLARAWAATQRDMGYATGIIPQTDGQWLVKVWDNPKSHVSFYETL